MRSIQTILLVWNLQRRAILTTKKVARTHSSVENFEILSVAPVLVDHLDGVLEGELVLHVSALVKDCRDGHLPRHVLPPHHHRHGQGQDNHHHWPPPHNSPRQVDQSARTKLFPHCLPPSPARQLPANWAGDSPRTAHQGVSTVQLAVHLSLFRHLLCKFNLSSCINQCQSWNVFATLQFIFPTRYIGYKGSAKCSRCRASWGRGGGGGERGKGKRHGEGPGGGLQFSFLGHLYNSHLLLGFANCIHKGRCPMV